LQWPDGFRKKPVECDAVADVEEFRLVTAPRQNMGGDEKLADGYDEDKRLKIPDAREEASRRENGSYGGPGRLAPYRE
jgi:hypothetical protein